MAGDLGGAARAVNALHPAMHDEGAFDPKEGAFVLFLF
jgi:hypothetical protein